MHARRPTHTQQRGLQYLTEGEVGGLDKANGQRQLNSKKKGGGKGRERKWLMDGTKTRVERET